MASRRTLLIVGGGAVGAYFLWPRVATPNGNPFETHAVKSVGDAFSTGGGTTTHTPGYATKRGDPESNIPPVEKVKGVGSEHFNDKHADQKIGQPGTFEKTFRSAHYGNEKGK